MVRKRLLSPKPLFDEDALIEFLDNYDVKRSHARRILAYVLAHPGCDFSEIRDLPKRIVKPLKEQFAVFTSTVVQTQHSTDGTVKLLVRMQDGHEVETVIIDHTDRLTLCVSSQVGCAMGCRFCATGTLGLSGNLWAGEIIEQMMHARKVKPHIYNMVYMGMGEPLENLEAVLGSIRVLIDPQLFQVPQKALTVSTVGVVPSMRRLFREAPKVNLALSLHAPTQELREQIVPSAKSYKIEDLVDCMDEFVSLGKKRHVLVEYVLIKDVNDSEEVAQQLADLMKGKEVKVNLIPYNSFEGNEFNYEEPSADQVQRFHKVLMRANVPVYVRVDHGRDIAAACGQLAKINAEAPPLTDIETIAEKPLPKTMEPVVRPGQNDPAPAPATNTRYLPYVAGAAVALIAVAWLRQR